MRANNTGRIIEVSFTRESAKNIEKCFEIRYKGGNWVDIKCSTTNTQKKLIEFPGLENIEVDVVSTSKAALREKLGVNAQIYLRNAPLQVPLVDKHVVGRVDVDCDYPNEFLVPNLFHISDPPVDLTANMTGRRYSPDIIDKANLFSAAGEYQCSWEPVKTPGVAPRASSKFNVNIYNDTIVCGTGDKSGTDLTHDVFINEVVENLPVSCSLKWKGSAASAVTLAWQKEDTAAVDPRNGGDSKGAEFTFSGNVTAPVIFECKVANATVFGSAAPPKPCRITLNPVQREAEEIEGVGLGAGWVIVIILVIIGIAFIIAVACAKDNCIMAKLKTVPCCKGCIKKLEDMKLISRWGTYKVRECRKRDKYYNDKKTDRHRQPAKRRSRQKERRQMSKESSSEAEKI